MKGILYSIIASLLIIPIIGLVIFSFNSIEKNIDSNIRANELEYFSTSLEEDLSRFLKIAGKRAIVSAVSKVVTEGAALADAQASLTEMIINGTLGGVVAPLIESNNLNMWEENVTRIANNSGFNLKLSNLSMEITQSDSFNVLFTERVFLNISDPNLNMGVAKTLVVEVAIPIDGIEDPLFPLKTYSRVIRVIRVSNVTNFTKYVSQGSIASGSVSGIAALSESGPSAQKIFVTGNMSQDIGVLNQFGGIVSESDFVPPGLARPYIAGAFNATSEIWGYGKVYIDSITRKVWSLENLTVFVKSGMYKGSANGPSFLDRLEGRLNLSSKYKYGLETIVDIENELIAQELHPLIDNQATCIDYLYWNGVPGSSIRNGNYDPIFEWLKIDSANSEIYGVDELT